MPHGASATLLRIVLSPPSDRVHAPTPCFLPFCEKTLRYRAPGRVRGTRSWVKESTVADKTAAFFGGGISSSGTLALKKSTVTRNTADFGAGVSPIRAIAVRRMKHWLERSAADSSG